MRELLTRAQPGNCRHLMYMPEVLVCGEKDPENISFSIRWWFSVTSVGVFVLIYLATYKLATTLQLEMHSLAALKARSSSVTHSVHATKSQLPAVAWALI